MNLPLDLLCLAGSPGFTQVEDVVSGVLAGHRSSPEDPARPVHIGSKLPVVLHQVLQEAHTLAVIYNSARPGPPPADFFTKLQALRARARGMSAEAAFSVPR